MTFQPSSVLFDKGVIRRVYERRARLAQGLQSTSLQDEAADVYDRISAIAQRLYIAQPTANVLRLRPQQHAAAILNDTRVLRKGRYLRRWARRLRDFNFSREDALIIAHGSFGADIDSLLVGVDVIITNDFKLANNFKAQYTNIEDRFKRMTFDLLDPYSSLELPVVNDDGRRAGFDITTQLVAGLFFQSICNQISTASGSERGSINDRPIEPRSLPLAVLIRRNPTTHNRKANKTTMKKKINVAMIGYQFMGRAHSNAWRQVSHFFDVPVEPVMKVICGRHEAAVKKAADALGWEETETDWRRLMERKDIDLIDICSPGDVHKPQAIAAAEAKKVVFCEKPLANTLKEAEQMLAAVKQNRVTHMLCHNYRRIPAVTLAKQMIEAGEIGDIFHYRGTYLQDWIVDPMFPRVWRLQKSVAGSGALGDIASHSIDLARYLVGEITEVSGLLKTFIKERPLPDNKKQMGKVDVDDAALSLVKFRNGAIGSIEGSRFATGRKNYNRFEINGSKGSIAFDLERMNELEVYKEEGANSGFKTVLATDASHPYFGAWWPPGHIIGYEHTFTHTIYDLLKAVDSRKNPSPNFDDGVKNQRVLAAIERSAKSKQWEKV